MNQVEKQIIIASEFSVLRKSYVQWFGIYGILQINYNRELHLLSSTYQISQCSVGRPCGRNVDNRKKAGVVPEAVIFFVRSIYIAQCDYQYCLYTPENYSRRKEVEESTYKHET